MTIYDMQRNNGKEKLVLFELERKNVPKNKKKYLIR
jgi:hypothetical protein